MGWQLDAMRLRRLTLLSFCLYTEEFFVVDFLVSTQAFPV
jgi:hypothetical protein